MKNLAQKTFTNEGPLELSINTFTKFSEKIYALAGVCLPHTEKNHSLVSNRLMKLLRNHGFKTYEEYWHLVEAGEETTLNEFISALTTNMTSFFREPAHFDFFKKNLQTFVKTSSEIRIWCAAASSGQEPYTIAMAASEVLSPFELTKLRILATDIDLSVLKKAAKGVYSSKEVDGLSRELLTKHFETSKLNHETYYRINKETHKLVHFAPFNLVSNHYNFKNRFHFIFCRNVLIYFDKPTTEKVIQNLAQQTHPGGYLIIGHSESGNVNNSMLRPIQQAVFQRKE